MRLVKDNLLYGAPSQALTVRTIRAVVQRSRAYPVNTGTRPDKSVNYWLTKDILSANLRKGLA